MRIQYWNPNTLDQHFEDICVSRLLDAAYVVKDATVRHLRSQIGKGETTGISRPMYKTGRYKDQPWTSREPGRLIKSIRVTRKKTKSGKAFSKKRNVRVYAGSYPPGVNDEENAYYAAIVEFYTPYMRPALASTLSQVKQIIGVK